VLGFLDDRGELVAMVSAVSDFLADRVWLVGQFVVTPALHGTGAPRAIYEAFESWVRDNGGDWIRLAVVVGNAKAERFWQKMGFTEVRRHDDVEMGDRVNTLSVMVKSLHDGAVTDYLALVPRDRPAPGR